MIRPNLAKWLALIALLTGAICSSALMTFDGGGWKKELAGHVPWALMPYALLLAAWFAPLLVRMHPSVQPALAWGVIVVALAGPLLYFDALFIHVDAQGALEVLMVPVMQVGGALFLFIAAVLWQWRIKQPAAKPAQPTVGLIRFGKFIKFVLATSMIGATFFYVFVSTLQYYDRKTIDTAKEVDFYISKYCEANKRLPTSAQLHERFPELSTNIGWYYFSRDNSWLKLQYPVRWRNSDAIGEPAISEFTATVYAYSIEYRCGDIK